MNKVRSQHQLAINGFSVSNHRFLNMIANGIIAAVEEDVPNLKLQYTGKSIHGNEISAVLVGEVVLASKEEFDTTSDKIRAMIQELKNPTNLIMVMKE